MYTTHGHWLSNTDEPPTGEFPPAMAVPCLGPLGCTVCAIDVANHPDTQSEAAARHANRMQTDKVYLHHAETMASSQMYQQANVDFQARSILDQLPSDAPLPTPAGSVPLDAVADWVVRYRELKAAEAKVKEMLAEARDRILECAKAQNPADDAQLTVAGQTFLRRQMVTQSRVDTTRLKREHPSLAQAYTTTSTYEKLTIV